MVARAAVVSEPLAAVTRVVEVPPRRVQPFAALALAVVLALETH